MDFMCPPRAILEGAGIRATVEQQVLPGDEARLRAAKVGAGVAELRRVALPAGGNVAQPLAERLLLAQAHLLRERGDGGPIPDRPEEAREQVIDGHVVLHRLAPEAGDEPGAAGAGTVGKTQRA